MSSGKWLALAIVLCVGFAVFAAACTDTPSSCGNRTELWFNEVVNQDECEDCKSFPFESSIWGQRTYRVRAKPDFAIGICGIARLETHPDAVTLMFSPTASEELRRFRESRAVRPRTDLVLVRVAGDSAPVAVVRAESLNWVLTLFDLNTTTEIDRFVGDLRPDPSSLIRNEQRLLPDDPMVSPAQAEANRLLRELEEEFPDLK